MTKRKPSEADAGLKLIIEWMDKEYDNNLGQSFFLVQHLKKKYSSFNQFYNEKYHAYLIEQGIRQPAKIFQFKKKQGGI